jgi:hypothetical protein
MDATLTLELAKPLATFGKLRVLRAFGGHTADAVSFLLKSRPGLRLEPMPPAPLLGAAALASRHSVRASLARVSC